MILVDTSVWVDHLRVGNERLKSLLLDEQVLCHPFIFGELACGSLRNRSEILGLIQSLPHATHAEHEEVLYLIDARKLYGQGLGWIDAHLLASALLTDVWLWTLDQPLEKAASSLKISYSI